MSGKGRAAVRYSLSGRPLAGPRSEPLLRSASSGYACDVRRRADAAARTRISWSSDRLTGADAAFLERFAEPVEINRSECAVVETVPRFSGFPPNHSPMIRPVVSIKACFDIGADDFGHVNRTVRREVPRFIKIAAAVHLHVAQMSEMDASATRKFASKRGDIVAKVCT